MKVIKAGAKKLWWVGRRALCHNCQASVEFETGDEVREFKNECGIMIYFNCPECGKEDRIYFTS